MARVPALLNHGQLQTLLLGYTSPVHQFTLSEAALDYLSYAWPHNTLRTYFRVMDQFRDWSGMQHPFPATPQMVLDYFTQRREAGLGPNSVRTEAAALRFIHRCLDFEDPTSHIAVQSIVRGVRRRAIEKNSWKPKRAPAMTAEDLKLLTQRGLDAKHLLRDLRDRAFLLLGFYGAFRQSELCNIRVEHIGEAEHGITIEMGITKTNQLAERDHTKAIPAAGGGMCPVEAVNDWVSKAELSKGYLFRGLTRFGRLREEPHKYSSKPLAHSACNEILRRRVALAGLQRGKPYSVHSLRAGFVTLARHLKAPDHEIQAQTGHTDAASLMIYTRPQDAFKDNAVMQIAAYIQSTYDTGTKP